MAVDANVDVPALLVIHTDKYAGNFERSLTAYCTGQVGDCGVGEKELGDFADAWAIHAAEQGYDKDGEEIENPFENWTMNVADDHGCYRPCSIWSGEDNSYNSIVIYFTGKPRKEDLEFILSQAYVYGQRKGIEILGAKFYTRETVVTDTLVWNK